MCATAPRRGPLPKLLWTNLLHYGSRLKIWDGCGISLGTGFGCPADYYSAWSRYFCRSNWSKSTIHFSSFLVSCPAFHFSVANSDDDLFQYRPLLYKLSGQNASGQNAARTKYNYYIYKIAKQETHILANVIGGIIVPRGWKRRRKTQPLLNLDCGEWTLLPIGHQHCMIRAKSQ